MSSSPYFVKDPNAIETFTVDWAAPLGTDTIASSSWIVPSGIAQVSIGNTTTKATIKLSGGTAGTTYMVTNRIITTTSGETLDASIYIVVEEQ